MANPLANPLLADMTGLPADFSVDDMDFEALDGFTPGIDHEENEFSTLHTNHRGYIGDDGNIYRKEIRWNWQTEEFEREYTDERVYFWNPPQELGDVGLNGDQEAAMAGPKGFGPVGLFTKEEIKATWDAKEGMGYLKQFTTWDKYWNFVEKATGLFTDSEYDDITGGNMTSGNWQDSPEYMALLEEAGIPAGYMNDDGDIFFFNGTTFNKKYKVDDSIGVEAINAAFLGIIGSVVAGPLLAGALAPTLGAAGAKAASSAIMSLAKDALTTGNLSLRDALISAGTAYLGEEFSEILGGIGDEVGAAEGGNLQKIVDGYKAGGASAKTIADMQAVVDGFNATSGDMAEINDAFRKLQEIAGVALDNIVDWQPTDDVVENSSTGWIQDDQGRWIYDPSAIQVQVPDYEADPEIEEEDDGGGDSGGDDGGGGEKQDTDGDGIPDDEDPYPEDPLNGGDPNGGKPQYEVVGQDENGNWIVRDNVDGDVWIVKGDYQVGDVLTEEDMADAVRDDGDLDGDGVNTDTDGDGIPDDSDQWPNIPNLPGIDPTVPGNELPDGSTVPDPNDPNDKSDTITPSFECESGYVDGNGACVPVDDPRLPGNDNDGDTNTETEGEDDNDTNTDNTGLKEGDSCPLADGSTGTIQNGVCTANSTGVNEGDACTMADGSAGTIQGGVCQSNNTGPKEGDECVLSDGSTGTIQGGVCKGKDTGSDGDGDGGDGDGGDGPGGEGLMAMAGGTGGGGRPVWGQLFASPQFRKHTPYQGKVTRRLFTDIMDIKR